MDNKKKFTYKLWGSRGGGKYGEALNASLQEYGFKLASEGELINFNFCGEDKYNHENYINSVHPSYLRDLDNKQKFYMLMKKYDLLNNVPKTYKNISDLTGDEFDNNKLYFLKHSGGTRGEKVFPVKSMEDINNIFKQMNITDVDKYLVQEEVPNMYLNQNNYKTSIRAYVLKCEYGTYLYNDGGVKIYDDEYDKDNIDAEKWRDIHVGNGSHKIVRFSDQEFYDKALPQMTNICSKLFNHYGKEDLFINKFSILGLDFILDKDYKPYLIEINTVPDLTLRRNRDVKQEMYNDFVKFYVLPKLEKKEPESSGIKNWIKIHSVPTHDLVAARIWQKARERKSR